MPELPEVETVRRGLTAVMEGRRITNVDVRRRDLRIALPEDFADALVGRTVVRLGRRAKYLVFELDDGTALLVHAGAADRAGAIIVDLDRRLSAHARFLVFLANAGR